MGDEPPQGEPGAWVSVREAARRLGVTPKAVRDRLKHGSLQARPKGNLGREVLLPPGVTTRESDGELPEKKAATLPGETAGEVAELLKEMAELCHALGRVEGELAAELRRSADLAAALDRERQEKASLRAELAEARRPWLARVLEGLSRKGS